MNMMRFFFGSKPQADVIHQDYQPDADLFFAWIGESRRAESVEVEPGIYVRVEPESRQVVSVEILDCAARFGLTAGPTEGFGEQMLQRYRDAALESFAASHDRVRLASAAR
jgi:hypothetical protein